VPLHGVPQGAGLAKPRLRRRERQQPLAERAQGPSCETQDQGKEPDRPPGSTRGQHNEDGKAPAQALPQQRRGDEEDEGQAEPPQERPQEDRLARASVAWANSGAIASNGSTARAGNRARVGTRNERSGGTTRRRRSERGRRFEASAIASPALTARLTSNARPRRGTSASRTRSGPRGTLLSWSWIAFLAPRGRGQNA
jgi:hypothetical protein